MANPSAETVTLGEALPREMARVRDEILPMYLQLRGMPNVIVEPQIAMMRADLDAAAKAMAEGDVVEMLRVYQSLKETAG
jgi:hypothetical protein